MPSNDRESVLVLPVSRSSALHSFIGSSLSSKLTQAQLLADLLAAGVVLVWPAIYLISWAVIRTKFSAALFGIALACSLVCLWILYVDPLHRFRTLFAG